MRVNDLIVLAIYISMLESQILKYGVEIIMQIIMANKINHV